MVKLNSKSTIWYDPSRFAANSWQTPSDWDGLVALTNQIKAAGKTPWALGAGTDSSWTLTDWFESIYLRNSGEQAYDKLFSKDGDWTDQSVKDAIKMMQDLLTNDNVAGGIDGALATAFVDGIGLVFSDNPTAEMYYEGGFVGGIATGQTNKDLKIGETIDWFNFPTFGGSGDTAAEIGGDEIAALTTKPGVKEFIQFMTGQDSGTTWAKTGAIISPVKAVDASSYPNDLAKKEAAQVAGASAVVYDGSDTLPAGAPDMGAMLQDVIQGKDATALLKTFNDGGKNAWASEK
jgi:alpha-glucoside transport system substrate-binding protein